MPPSLGGGETLSELLSPCDPQFPDLYRGAALSPCLLGSLTREKCPAESGHAAGPAYLLATVSVRRAKASVPAPFRSSLPGTRCLSHVPCS